MEQRLLPVKRKTVLSGSNSRVAVFTECHNIGETNTHQQHMNQHPYFPTKMHFFPSNYSGAPPIMCEH